MAARSVLLLGDRGQPEDGRLVQRIAPQNLVELRDRVKRLELQIDRLQPREVPPNPGNSAANSGGER